MLIALLSAEEEISDLFLHAQEEFLLHDFPQMRSASFSPTRKARDCHRAVSLRLSHSRAARIADVRLWFGPNAPGVTGLLPIGSNSTVHPFPTGTAQYSPTLFTSTSNYATFSGFNPRPCVRGDFHAQSIIPELSTNISVSVLLLKIMFLLLFV
jgi:hypothetical protein